MDATEKKRSAAKASLEFIEPGTSLGVGTGSTVNCLIELLPTIRDRIDAVVSSSRASTALLEAQGFDVKVGRFPFAASAKATILGDNEGFVKVVSEAKYDELLGVHIIGPHATDLIAEAVVALEHEATSESLMRAVHAHPTLSEAVAEAAHGAVEMPIHV